jgi:hypothetical protein
MASVLSITDDPSLIPASALANPAGDALQQRRVRFEARVQELRRKGFAAAAAVSADL